MVLSTRQVGLHSKALSQKSWSKQTNKQTKFSKDWEKEMGEELTVGGMGVRWGHLHREGQPSWRRQNHTMWWFGVGRRVCLLQNIRLVPYANGKFDLIFHLFSGLLSPCRDKSYSWELWSIDFLAFLQSQKPQQQEPVWLKGPGLSESPEILLTVLLHPIFFLIQ